MKNLYLILTFLLCTFLSQAQISEPEFQALKTFYNATGGNQWTKKTGWQYINTTATANDVNSSWSGLELSDGHVTKIAMNSNNLVGYLPSAIGNLTWLKAIEVDNCKLGGAIPTEIGNLVNLEGLTLSSNQFTSLPASMSNLVKLKYLYLSNNPLNCPFPSDLVKSWPVIEILQFGQCGLTGTLPDIFQFTPKLYMFSLYRNSMSGSLPPSISKLTKIYELDLTKNGFTGSLPTLDSCKALSYVQFGENSFTGSVPASWTALAAARTLNIYTNQLSGTIPSGIFTPTLTRMDAGGNFYTFEGIEPNIEKINALSSKVFSTTRLFPLQQKTVSVNSGEALTLNAATLSNYKLGGNNNRYKWFRNNTEIWSGNDPSYTVASAGITHSGIYRFEVTNTAVPDITLKSENLLVSVLVAGNKAPDNITLSVQSVDENYTGSFAVLKASDPDAGDTHTFSLTSGNGSDDKDNGLFTIVNNNLLFNSGADFETKPTVYFLVTANDLKGGIYTKAMSLKINDVNEAPAFTGQITSTTIDETAPNGHAVLILVAKDPEGSSVTYSINQGNEDGAFGISGNKLVVIDNTKLKYDTKNQYTLKVSASDGNLAGTTTLVVTLSKINKMPTVENSTFSLAENTAAGALVGNITGSDPEGVVLIFSIVSGNTGDAFRLNGNQILVNNAAAVDYDARTAFNLVVNATDGISNVQATITINLTNQSDETGNDILSFTIPGLVEPPVIDAVAKTIKAKVEGVSLGALKADFTLSKGATSNPASGSVLNFGSQQSIRVTAEKGGYSDWQIRVTIPSPVHQQEMPAVSMYPNPATDYVSISGLPGNSTLRLISASGSLVMQKKTTSTVEVLPLSDQAPGLYLLSVESAQGHTIVKIIRK